MPQSQKDETAYAQPVQSITRDEMVSRAAWQGVVGVGGTAGVAPLRAVYSSNPLTARRVRLAVICTERVYGSGHFVSFLQVEMTSLPVEMRYVLSPLATLGLSWCFRGLGLGGFHPVPGTWIVREDLFHGVHASD